MRTFFLRLGFPIILMILSSNSLFSKTNADSIVVFEDDKKLKAEFETWKKQAKEKIIKLKHGELTEDEVYEWLQENK